MTHELNNPNAISIDRIDSSKGYVPGNVQLVCQWVNIAKGRYSNEQFRRVLLDVYVAQRLRVERRGKTNVDDRPDNFLFPAFEALFERLTDKLWRLPWLTLQLLPNGVIIDRAGKDWAVRVCEHEGEVVVQMQGIRMQCTMASEGSRYFTLADPDVFEYVFDEVCRRVGEDLDGEWWES